MKTVVAAAVALLALFGAGVAEATDRRDHHRWDGARRHHDDGRHRGWDRHDRWDHRRDRWDHDRHRHHRHGWNRHHQHHDGGRVIYVYPRYYGFW
jgi:Ni/Co efflux regulator RcnB